MGSKKDVDAMSKNPLARAVRIDKYTAAALEATLTLYADGMAHEIPVWKALGKQLDVIETQANDLAASLKSVGVSCVVEPCESEPGGGSLPDLKLKSFRVGLQGAKPDEWARNLRSAECPVIGYVERGIFWLDMRTVEPHELSAIADTAAEYVL
jgi:L-seryl-tRNA(Ser) seleniumtransferase